MKTCSRCGTEKTLDLFYPDIRYKLGVAPWCRDCVKGRNAQRSRPEMAQYTAKYKERNPDRVKTADRRTKLRTKFGLSPADFAQMVEDQNGVCAICHQPERARWNDGRLKSLAVDHDHDTGQIRGLLCSGCNVGLGCFGNDPTRLAGAIEYLRKTERAAWRSAAG